MSAAALAWGLQWGRTSVADLEAGRRPVSLVELALLPLVMSSACGRVVGLEDLLRGDEPINLTARLQLTGDQLLDLFARPGIQRRERERREQTLTAVLKRLGEPQPLPRPPAETEKKAAARLGWPVERVVQRALAIWGMRLDERRDQLVGDEPRTRGALGHVTRRLVAELAAAGDAEGDVDDIGPILREVVFEPLDEQVKDPRGAH